MHLFLSAVSSVTVILLLSACQLQPRFNSELSLVSPSQNHLVRSGQSVRGAELTTYTEQGQAVPLKIGDVELDATDPDQEIYLYTVLYQTETSSSWQNLCVPDAEGVAKAIPLSGHWDATGAHIDDGGVTFACTNGVLAKCVRWGYKPWKSFEGNSLRDFHQACTRMARADYCGDGVGHTKNGTPINIYDRLKIQTPSPDTEMTFEAAWTPDGAMEINHTRWPEALKDVQSNCPERLQVQELTPTDIQARQPNTLIFNDSLVQTH